MPSKTPGSIIRAAREAADLSLAGLAAAIGVSAPYIHDLEHDRRRLVAARWGALRKALPELNVRWFVEATIATGPVEVDPSTLTLEHRAALVDALVAATSA